MEHGGSLMEKGNYPIALEAFEAAATLEPSFAEVSKWGHILQVAGMDAPRFGGV
jgi:hypothetical protein